MINVHGEKEDLKTLFQSLRNVNNDITRLPKSGRYAAGGTRYEYATEADVIEPISNAYAQNNLTVIPSCNNQEWFTIETRSGHQNLCRVEVELLIGCTQTGAYITTTGQSAAANGDKAPNAAFTTALKYLLAKTALTAFGDDADEYNGVEKAGTQHHGADTTMIMQSATRNKTGDLVKKHIVDNKWKWTQLTSEQATILQNIADGKDQ